MADPTALYSYQGQEPRPLPHEIHYQESWGATNFRQGVESFTNEELEKAGYTGPYERPEFNSEVETQTWDSELGDWVTTPIPEEILWAQIRAERNRCLAESDWTMAADAPESLNFREWEMYRQRLRDLPSLYQNPKDVIFPISPEGRPDDDFDQPRVYEDRIIWRVRDSAAMIKKLINQLSSQQVSVASTTEV